MSVSPLPQISIPSRIHTAAAFTLIEIVLAIGVISFALVAIMGLFPVAMTSSADSQRETQAALIARRIFSDLSARKPFIQLRGSDPTHDFQSVDLDKPMQFETDYDEGGVLPNGATVGSAHTTGMPVYHATISIQTDNLPQQKLTRVEIVITTPVGVPAQNQKKFVFVSLLNSDQPSTIATP